MTKTKRKEVKSLEITVVQKGLSERSKRLFKTYGITHSEWLDILHEQFGVCAICKVNSLETRLCVDHIHVKGFKKLSPEKKRPYIRGLLCFMCNTALKGFEKTIDGKRNRAQLLNTLEYFKKYSLKGEM